jgi:hypothetical protein
MEPRRIPVFATEAEEAKWWYDHREEIADDLFAASREGRLGEGSKARWARIQAQKQNAETAAAQTVEIAAHPNRSDLRTRSSFRNPIPVGQPSSGGSTMPAAPHPRGLAIHFPTLAELRAHPAIAGYARRPLWVSSAVRACA